LPVMKITTRVTSCSFEVASFAPGRWTEWVTLFGMTNDLLQRVPTCERGRPAARSPHASTITASSRTTITGSSASPAPRTISPVRNRREHRASALQYPVPAAWPRSCRAPH
jgi:hypothetical protein